MANVRLFLLDGFDLTIEGDSQPLQLAMQRVLAVVALAPRGVTRSRVAFQLWPDKPEERAKANLRSCLWRLGKLPVETIQATKTSLKLHDELWVDVREGLAELALGDESAIAESLLPFHTLQADLLPDWYDDWLIVERERFRQFRLHALEKRARQALADGRSGAAIQIALAAVAIDPYRESAHRLAVEAHLAEGNNYEARREFARYCEFVAIDLTDPKREFDNWVVDTRRAVTLR